MTESPNPQLKSPEMEDESEDEMTIWDHLKELRNRLFIGLISMVVTSGLSFIFADKIIGVLANPLGGIQNFLSIEVTENMGVFMRVSLLSGFIFSLPIILYEILGFVVPGLTDQEKRWVYISIPFATLLFLCGVAFTYFVMMPTAIPFLINFLNIKTISPTFFLYRFCYRVNVLGWGAVRTAAGDVRPGQTGPGDRHLPAQGLAFCNRDHRGGRGCGYANHRPDQYGHLDAAIDPAVLLECGHGSHRRAQPHP